MLEEKLPRRERDKLRQRREILAAALELFTEKGFHNTPMHQIAEKAEFAVGTLYKFFRDKEDLYRSLVMEQALEFHAQLTEVLERPGEEVEKVCRYIRVKAEIFSRRKQMLKLYFAETRGVSHNVMAGMDSDIRNLHRTGIQKLAAVFESGIERGCFRPVAAPFHLAVALDSLTSTFLFLWIEQPEDHPFEECLESIKAVFFEQVINSKEERTSC